MVTRYEDTYYYLTGILTDTILVKLEPGSQNLADFFIKVGMKIPAQETPWVATSSPSKQFTLKFYVLDYRVVDKIGHAATTDQRRFWNLKRPDDIF